MRVSRRLRGLRVLRGERGRREEWPGERKWPDFGCGAKRRSPQEPSGARADARERKKDQPDEGLVLGVGGGAVPRIKRLLKVRNRSAAGCCTLANSIEKPIGTALGGGRSSRFFASIGGRKGCSTSPAFCGQFNSRNRNRTRVRRPEPVSRDSQLPQPKTHPFTPIHEVWRRQSPRPVRRMALTITASCAANNLRMLRMRPIISA